MKRLLRDQSYASVLLISFTSMVLLIFMAWTPTAHGGACCVVKGTKIIDIECVDVSSINDCDAIEGAYWGDDVSCDVKPCVLNEVTGACCFPNGGCIEASESVCVDTLGGVFQGAGIDCYKANCPLAKGACCFSDNSCFYLVESECTRLRGEYLGDGSGCIGGKCPRPPGGQQPASVPAMTFWGLLGFVILLIVAYAWFIMRKRKRTS